MPYNVTYPPGPPTVSGDLITVSAYLNNPTRVQRLVADLTAQRFIADRLFSPGPAVNGGAVIYDQVLTSDLYTDRDVEEIRPGMEFPILTEGAPVPKTAAAAKYGGAEKITYENQRRNALDVFVRAVRKLSNTIVRKTDAVAIAALDAAPIGSFVGTDWTAASGATMIANLIDAGDVIDAVEAGYAPDLVLLHPTQFNELLKNKDFRDSMTGPGGDESLLRDGIIGNFLGWTFGKSRRITAGTGYLASSGLVGGISDEVPLQTQVIDWPREESWYIQAKRVPVMYVTDPKSVVKLTGI